MSKVSERMRAAERTSEANRAKQVKEWVVRVNKRADERMAQYSTRRFHNILAHCACVPKNFDAHALGFNVKCDTTKLLDKLEMFAIVPIFLQK